MTTSIAELEERRLQALRDLTELDEQLAAGEIDAETAARLRRVYEAEAAAAIEALSAAGSDRADDDPPDDREPADVDPDPSDDGSLRRRPRGRMLLTGAVLVATLTAGGVLLADQLSPRPVGGFITGNLPATATDGVAAEDVSTEELEEVVAANPDVVGMRLALADRYFEAGEAGAAYEHYWEALQREPHPHALARLGWIVAEQGEPELGAQLLEESLERRPDHPEAMFLLATVHLQLGETDQAHDLLTRVLEQDGLSPEEEQLVQGLLAELEGAEEDTP